MYRIMQNKTSDYENNLRKQRRLTNEERKQER